MLIGVASAVFQLRCPGEILSNDGVAGYIDKTRSTLTKAQFTSFCERVGIEEPIASGPDSFTYNQGGFVSRDQWLSFRAEDISEVLSRHYACQLQIRTLDRLIVGVLFVFGALVTLLPTFYTVWWVISELWPHSISS